MAAMFTTLGSTGIAAFCAGTEDPQGLRARLARELEGGWVRPDWCWLALGPAGQVLARHYWWARPGCRCPQGLDHVSAERPASAVELIVHARRRLGVESARCEVMAPIEEGDPSLARADVVAVLLESGFAFEVARVSLEWTPGQPLVPAGDRLVFRSARELPDDLLVDLFAAVADGALDHGMMSDRASLGAEAAARRRLEAVRSYGGEPGWFSVAFSRHDEPVGYVVPGMAGGTPMVGEIGIAASHRGHRYVDDLLSFATRLLAAAGAERIVADTDRSNMAMRRAFARGGYREYAGRDDYCWEPARTRRGELRPPPAEPPVWPPLSEGRARRRCSPSPRRRPGSARR